MVKSAFEKIAEGLGDALAIAKGEKKPAKLYVPAEVDIRAIREKLDLSQDDFAAEFGFTIHQIRQWEQRRSRPLGGLRAYLMMIDNSPDDVRALLRSATSRRQAA